MKTHTVFSILATFLFLGFTSQAAELEVNWKEPDSYVDIRSRGPDQKRYRADVFYGIERHLKKLVKKLPEDNKLSIEVTDLDLAGEVLFSHGDFVRVVVEPYTPRIEFSYKLTDGKAQVISEGEENIRDVAFFTNRSSRFKRETFGAEMKIFDDWFKDNFSPLIASK